MTGGSDKGVEKKENDLRMGDRLDIAAAYAQASARQRARPGDRETWLTREHLRDAVIGPGFFNGFGDLVRALPVRGQGWNPIAVPLAMSTGSGTGGSFGTRSGGRGGNFPAGGGDPGRPERPGRSTPPTPPANFQPEERYWTDYLRIALPVVGLLLMLGLFLFWAGELIGDEAEPTNTPDVALVEENNVPPTETPTSEADVALQASSAPGATSQTPTPSQAGEGAATKPTATATTAPAETEPTATTEPTTGELAIGATAVVNEDAVNCRGDPTTESAAITQLTVDTTVTILDGPVDAEDYTWWYVELEDGTSGWVVSDYLSPA
jgi:hypothetical protein